MRKKNRIIQSICIAAVFVIVITSMLFGRCKYTAKEKIEMIDSSVSADGNYELLFQSVGEPDWPFGPAHAGFVLKTNGRVITEYRFDVANDGKTLCAYNWQVTWKNRSAEVLISGEEQPDMLYSLDFDGDVKASTAGGDAAFTCHIAFANWTGNSGIYCWALNSDKMIISSAQHLPVYKFDTKADLDAFKTSFKDVLTMDQGLDEIPSFESITAAYDDSFFSRYSLLLAYVPASSGSFRFGVGDVYCDGQSFCIYVEQLNDPESYDTMMAGWFAVVEVDKAAITDCTSFDAQLGKPTV